MKQTKSFFSSDIKMWAVSWSYVWTHWWWSAVDYHLIAQVSTILRPNKNNCWIFFFFFLIISLPVFDMYIEQCHRVKETTLNTSILYPCLFLLCVIDIPVAVLRSLWKKSKVRYYRGCFKTCSEVYVKFTWEYHRHKKKV